MNALLAAPAATRDDANRAPSRLVGRLLHRSGAQVRIYPPTALQSVIDAYDRLPGRTTPSSVAACPSPTATG